MVPNIGPPDVLGPQLPEAFTTTSAGQDFWELKSKNIWKPKVGDHCPRGLHRSANSLQVLIWFPQAGPVSDLMWPILSLHHLGPRYSDCFEIFIGLNGEMAVAVEYGTMKLGNTVDVKGRIH